MFESLTDISFALVGALLVVISLCIAIKCCVKNDTLDIVPTAQVATAHTNTASGVQNPFFSTSNNSEANIPEATIID